MVSVHRFASAGLASLRLCSSAVLDSLENRVMSLHVFSRIKPSCRVLQALFVLGALGIAGAVGAATCRVAVDGTSGGNGSDWGVQAMNLQTALNEAGARATGECLRRFDTEGSKIFSKSCLRWGTQLSSCA